MASLSRLVAVVLLSTALVGCDPSHALAIDNGTDLAFVVRVTETSYAKDFGNEVSYFDVSAGAKGYVFPPEIGPLEGTVDVLDTTCNPVASIAARSGSIITIKAGLALDIRYLGDGDFPLPNSFAASNRCH